MSDSPKNSYVDMKQFLELAIRFEVESAEFYRQMRETVEKKTVRRLLETFETQEREHEQTLRSYTVPGDREIILQFAPELSLSMPMPSYDPDFKEMLEVAVARERKSVEIYRSAADRTTGEFRELLEGLAAFEEEHERRLKRIQAPRR